MVRQVVLQGRVWNSRSYSRSTRSTGCNRENFGVGGGGIFAVLPVLLNQYFPLHLHYIQTDKAHNSTLKNPHYFTISVGQVVLQGRVGNSRSYCLSHSRSHGRVGCGTGGHTVGQAVG